MAIKKSRSVGSSVIPILVAVFVLVALFGAVFLVRRNQSLQSKATDVGQAQINLVPSDGQLTIGDKPVQIWFSAKNSVAFVRVVVKFDHNLLQIKGDDNAPAAILNEKRYSLLVPTTPVAKANTSGEILIVAAISPHSLQPGTPDGNFNLATIPFFVSDEQPDGTKTTVSVDLGRSESFDDLGNKITLGSTDSTFDFIKSTIVDSNLGLSQNTFQSQNFTVTGAGGTALTKTRIIASWNKPTITDYFFLVKLRPVGQPRINENTYNGQINSRTFEEVLPAGKYNLVVFVVHTSVPLIERQIYPFEIK